MRPGGLLHRLPVTAQASRPGWWVTFGLLGSLFGLWSLSSPLISVPDEGAHIVAAAAAVRGDLSGPTTITRNGVITMVEVPEFYAHANEFQYRCFAFQPEEPAGCAPRIRGSDQPTRGVTNFAHYPPLPYTLFGLPSLLPGSVTALRLMRLVGGLVCAALVASGLASATSIGRGMTLAATLLAVTPMAAFLAGSVNTSGLEIAAAIALWPSLLVLLERGRAAPTRLVVRTAVAAGALVVTRPISPLWLVLIVAVVLLAIGGRKVRDALGDGRMRGAIAAVGVVTGVSLAWIFLADSLARVGGAGQGRGFAHDFLASTGMFETRLKEMFGVQGWLDTPPPVGFFYLWVAAVGGLLLLAVVAGARRGVLALAATAAMVYLVPVTIEAARARTSGFPWQGRYTLPLAVGVPILAGWLVDGSPQVVSAIVRRAGRVLVVVACSAQLLAHVWSTRRYVAGLHGRIVYFLADGWQPPLPAWLLLVMFLAVVTALGVWIDALVRTRAAVAAEP